MKPLQQRLKAVMQDGNLTVADLARWFGRPDPTVRGWVSNGGSPGGGPIDIKEVEVLLSSLEKLIKSSKALPLPRLSPSERIKRLQDIRSKVKPNWVWY